MKASAIGRSRPVPVGRRRTNAERPAAVSMEGYCANDFNAPNEVGGAGDEGGDGFQETGGEEVGG
jgi:hypothetical protein